MQVREYNISTGVESWRDYTPEELADIAATPQPTQDQIIKKFTDAIQKRLDDFAKTRNYDGILSACTYHNSTIPQFQAEGLYCIAARDNTWAAAYTILNDVLAGNRAVPQSIADFENDLPALIWPQ